MRQYHGFEENPALMPFFCIRFADCFCRTAFLFCPYSLVRKLNRNLTTRPKYFLLFQGGIKLWIGSWMHSQWVPWHRLCSHTNTKAPELLWPPEMVLVCHNTGKHCTQHLPAFCSWAWNCSSIPETLAITWTKIGLPTQIWFAASW